MNKIPTAQKFIHQFQDKYRGTYGGVVKNLIIEFAKFHIKAVLEAAAITEFTTEFTYRTYSRS